MRQKAVAVAALFVAGLATAALTAPASAAPIQHSANATTTAVIGDTPYGPTQFEAFPQLVDDANGDPKVRTVIHVG